MFHFSDSSDQTADVIRLPETIFLRYLTEKTSVPHKSSDILLGASSYIENLKKPNFNLLVKDLIDIVKSVDKVLCENNHLNDSINTFKTTIIAQIKSIIPDKSNKTIDLNNLQKVCEVNEVPQKQPKDPNGIMVVIPRVWKLKPDKLTEHQIEKMKERRRDIPALYNDCSSSSMDSVIQPWTPNRIIVPGATSNDKIIIEDPSLQENSLFGKSQNTPITVTEEQPFKMPFQNAIPSYNEEDLIDKIIQQVKKDNLGASPKKSPRKESPKEIVNGLNNAKEAENNEDTIVSSQPISPAKPRASKRRRTLNGTPNSQASPKTPKLRKLKKVPSPNNSSTDTEKLALISNKSTPTSDKKSPSLETKQKSPVNANKKATEDKNLPEAVVEPVVAENQKNGQEEKSDKATQGKRTSPRKSVQTTAVTPNSESPKKLVLRIVRKDSPPDQKQDKFLIAKNLNEILTDDITELNSDDFANVQETPSSESNPIVSVPNTLPTENNQVIDITESEKLPLNDSVTSVDIDDQQANTSTKTIRSSPELSDAEEREQDLLNSTMNLSPIIFEKPPRRTANSSTPKPANNALSSPELRRRRYTLAHRSQIPNGNTNSTNSPSTSIVRPNRSFQSNRGRHLYDLIQMKPSDAKLNMMNNKKDFSPEILKNGRTDYAMDGIVTSSPVTHVENRMLTFSKKVPSSDASPSISILKRKLDESDIDSPLHKVCFYRVTLNLCFIIRIKKLYDIIF